MILQSCRICAMKFTPYRMARFKHTQRKAMNGSFQMQHKKFIKIIVFGIAICALGLRICYVNITAEHPHVETYQMNEWVELNGNFQEESAEETTGYAVRVNSARLLTYKEFIEQYNGNIDCLPESARPIGIVDVEVSVKNTANLSGWLSLYYYMLTSADHTFTLYLNSTLFELAAPSSNGELNIRIKPNSEYTFHIPYGYFSERIDIARMDTKYNMVVSHYPVRKECNVLLREN
ncbi:DUF5028 domain-containing protein [Butyricicoccus sp. AM27-36]|nr:DUF5028 domain-containing protein [Butyricicoccus sp. AM27-36]